MRAREKNKSVHNKTIVSETCSDENFPKQTEKVTNCVVGELNDVSLQFSDCIYNANVQNFPAGYNVKSNIYFFRSTV